jgi:serine/threonine protein kinase
MNLQQSLSHPFIVNMRALQQDSRSLYLMMDYVDGGELYKLIQSLGKLEPSQARFFASQIVLCFEYLHERNFIYRDLKPENVLIHTSGYLKLSDFGFIKRLKDGERTYTICGTPEYLAPEIIMNKGHGKAVDWYTLGIFIYELLVGRCPFMNEDPFEIFKKIVQTKITFPKDMDKGAKSLIRHLTDHDLSKRYGNLKHGVEDIKRHRFFKDINFYSIITQAVTPSYIPEENPLRQKKMILK